MSNPSNSDGSAAISQNWFAGDRRLYCLAGTAALNLCEHPEQLVAGCAVQLPRSIRHALSIGEELRFTLTEIKVFGFGSMGFCEVDGQPGRGAWIYMCHLSRSEWHTPQHRSGSTRRRR